MKDKKEKIRYKNLIFCLYTFLLCNLLDNFLDLRNEDFYPIYFNNDFDKS